MRVITKPCMVSNEDIERLRKNPDLLIEALNELLITSPEALIRALINRPETLARLMVLMASLPLAIPAILLRILAALAIPPAIMAMWTR